MNDPLSSGELHAERSPRCSGRSGVPIDKVGIFSTAPTGGGVGAAPGAQFRRGERWWYRNPGDWHSHQNSRHPECIQKQRRTLEAMIKASPGKAATEVRGGCSSGAWWPVVEKDTNSWQSQARPKSHIPERVRETIKGHIPCNPFPPASLAASPAHAPSPNECHQGRKNIDGDLQNTPKHA